MNQCFVGIYQNNNNIQLQDHEKRKAIKNYFNYYTYKF